MATPWIIEWKHVDNTIGSDVPSAGSESTPYKTLAYAVSEIKLLGTGEGYGIKQRGSEIISSPINIVGLYGTMLKRIVITGCNNSWEIDGTKVEYDGNSLCSNLFTGDVTTDAFVIQHMIIKNFTTYMFIGANYGNYWIFNNVYIENVPHFASPHNVFHTSIFVDITMYNCTSVDSGIPIFSMTGSVIDRLRLIECTTFNNTIILYLYGSTQASNILIHDCIGRIGISMHASSTLRNCIIDGCTLGEVAYGGAIYAASANSIIKDIIISNTTTTGTTYGGGIVAGMYVYVENLWHYNCSFQTGKGLFDDYGANSNFIIDKPESEMELTEDPYEDQANDDFRIKTTLPDVRREKLKLGDFNHRFFQLNGEV